MKIILSTLVAGHMHTLAKYLFKKKILARMISSYPSWKLKQQNLPVESGLIKTCPWLITPYLGLYKYNLLNYRIEKKISILSHKLHDRFARVNLISADIFHGLSCHNLNAGIQAKKMGMKYICDHGSSHIKFQNTIMTEEQELTGIKIRTGGLVNPEVIETEQMEYNFSDKIFVASQFSKTTFISHGVSESKITVVPYGVNLSDFYPVKVDKDNKFRVVYVGALSMRKGIHYLIQAFNSLNLKKSELVLIGKKCEETEKLLAKSRLDDRIIQTGIISRSEIRKWLSRSDVFVLPSIEDGYGLVILEAQACGLPVIATVNTGSLESIQDNINGFIIPIRSSTAIAEKLLFLYQNPNIAKAMGKNALQSVSMRGGWDTYFSQVLKEYSEILKIN